VREYSDEELWDALMRAHKELTLPAFAKVLDLSLEPLLEDMRRGFAEAHRRIDEIHAIFGADPLPPSD
jgi:hypothetical protein